MFSLRAWQSSLTTSLQVLFGLPLGLEPSTSYSMHFFTQSSSSLRSTCPYQRSLFQFITHTHTHTRLTAFCPGLPGWAGTRKVKPIWILLKQETVSGSGMSWAIYKSAHCSRQITTPAPHHSVFYRPDALPATQPTASKHWRNSQFIVFVWKPDRPWFGVSRCAAARLASGPTPSLGRWSGHRRTSRRRQPLRTVKSPWTSCHRRRRSLV